MLAFSKRGFLVAREADEDFFIMLTSIHVTGILLSSTGSVYSLTLGIVIKELLIYTEY